MEGNLKGFADIRFMDFLRNGIMIIDRNYRIMYVNPAAEKLLKINFPRVQNKNVYEVFPDAPEDVRHLEHTIKFNKPRKIEKMPYLWGQFSYYLTLETNLILDEEKVIGAIAEFTDVTDYVVREEKLKKSLEEIASNVILLESEKGILPLNQIIMDELDIQKITQKVLEVVSNQKIRTLILDFSSVLEANEIFFKTIDSLIRALRLLGVKVIITGIKSAVARQIVVMDVPINKSNVTLLNSLADIRS